MAKVKLRPLNDKIVVKRLEAEAKTKGGIVLPDTAKEKPKEGRVISLGDGKLLKDGTRAKFNLKKNDRVIFSSYAALQGDGVGARGDVAEAFLVDAGGEPRPSPLSCRGSCPLRR